MGRTADAMNALATALTEWRDSGGSVDEVVVRIMDIADARIEASRNWQEPSAPETVAEPPTWEDLRGAAPHATGDLSSEKFVRKLRDEWPDPSAPKIEGEQK